MCGLSYWRSLQTMPTRNGKYLNSSLKTTLYRQERFLAWDQHKTELGGKWEQKLHIKTLMTPSAQGRLSGLNGDFVFGFSTLDFIAPDKLYKKEVLEHLRRFLEKAKTFLSNSLLWLRSGEELSYFQERLVVPAETQCLFQEKSTTLPVGICSSNSGEIESVFSVV